MPCFVDGPLTDEERGWPRQKAAALCAILGVLERDDHRSLAVVLSAIDWQEAGITREWLELWWANHKAEDVARRRMIERTNADEATRKTALSKLTASDRAALGLENPRSTHQQENGQ